MSPIERVFRSLMVSDGAPEWLEPFKHTPPPPVNSGGLFSAYEYAGAAYDKVGGIYHATFHFKPKGLSSDTGPLYVKKCDIVIIDDLESEDL